MQPAQRVALAAAGELAAHLNGSGVLARPRVGQRVRPLPPVEGLDHRQRQAVKDLAPAVVEVVLSLAGRRLALGEAETAVRREVPKRLMASPDLERTVAARM
ncbi:MAG: hypothetical protein K9K66_04560, partial [Desulfarculaceae bacterium]|nr:hypothetical protein [Desulfarculaceae bacterium]